ncbi:hypothetical protein ACIF6H_12010 [Streptomyces microflavus]
MGDRVEQMPTRRGETGRALECLAVDSPDAEVDRVTAGSVAALPVAR